VGAAGHRWPPSTEPVTQARIGFTREGVDRVLADL